MANVSSPIGSNEVDWALAEAYRLGPMAALAHHGLSGGAARNWYLPYQDEFLDLKAVWRLALFRAKAPSSYNSFKTGQAYSVLKSLNYTAVPKAKTDDHKRTPGDVKRVDEVRNRRWAQILARPGQARFRRQLLSKFKRCMASGVAEPNALEAAHIIPVPDGGGDTVENGLLLRVDIHRLFDRGLVSLTQDGCMCVAEDVDDPMYRSLDGRRLKISTKDIEARQAYFQARSALTFP